MKRILIIAVLLFASVSMFAQKGYEKSVEINGAVGLDDCQKYTFGISMINGYRISESLFVGAGVGYEYLEGLYYHSYEYKGSIIGSTSYDSIDVRNNIQLFGRVKFNLIKSKISPFLTADAGYTIGLSSNEIKMANGFFFQPSFGCDFKIDDVQSVYVMLGYNGQNYTYRWFDNTLGSTDDKMITKLAGKFCLHIGFKF